MLFSRKSKQRRLGKRTYRFCKNSKLLCPYIVVECLHVLAMLVRWSRQGLDIASRGFTPSGRYCAIKRTSVGGGPTSTPTTPADEPIPAHFPVHVEEPIPAHFPVHAEEPIPAHFPVHADEPIPAHSTVSADEPIPAHPPSIETSRGPSRFTPQEYICSTPLGTAFRCVYYYIYV